MNILKIKGLAIALAIVMMVSCSDDEPVAVLSDEKAITSFVFAAADNDALSEDVTATITGTAITATFPIGTNVTALLPTIAVSGSATVSPTTAQDFTEAVTFTVTAEDGSTAEYTTNITVETSNAKQILSFVFTAEDNDVLSSDVTAMIDEDNFTIKVEVPFETDITGLVPTIEISEFATITPIGVQDFSNPITYTVTAEDENTVEYTSDITVGEQRPFVTTWETTTANESITIYKNDNISGYNYQIDWGDGTVENNRTGDATHEYEIAGIYSVKISGDFYGIRQSLGTNAEKLQTIESWGDIKWKSMERAFFYCSDMIYNAEDVPNLEEVTSMDLMFSNATSFNGDIGDWDVSNVTTMQEMFRGAFSFNQSIDAWDVSNVEDMYGMFDTATSFNQDLNNWDVSSVTRMQTMFSGFSSNITVFNGNISSWDVSNVVDMWGMFRFNSSFNQDISNWNVSNVTSMGSMFRNVASFSQDISAWTTDNVTNCSDFSTNSGLTTEQLPTAGSCFGE